MSAFVWIVRYPNYDDEINVFSSGEAARDFAAIFRDATVEEYPLLDGDYVAEVEAELEMEGR